MGAGGGSLTDSSQTSCTRYTVTMTLTVTAKPPEVIVYFISHLGSAFSGFWLVQDSTHVRSRTGVPKLRAGVS